MDKLEEATLDTLGRTASVHLEEYGQPQVRDITASRAEEAFEPCAVPENIINFIAQISMRYGGVRYALQLLLEAGDLAEMGLTQSVKAGHVRRAHLNIPKRNYLNATT